MINWLQQLEEYLVTSTTLVLISVLRVSGSVPRQPGAKMIVTAQQQWGTIGGGNLEYSAVKLARSRLQQFVRSPHCEIMLLGPTLGQCCGGRVELLFETIDAQNSPHVLNLATGLLYRAITDVPSTRFESCAINDGAPFKGRQPFVKQEEGRLYFYEPATPLRPQVWVFGAGHVGRAVVEQLSLLPCDIVWLDEREEMFEGPTTVTASVVTGVDVVQELNLAGDEVSFVIMTHSHALDYELCCSILARQFAFVGLIGSKTKRANFSRRLTHRGFSEAQIERLVCPIGVGNIRSKHPHAIALSLALQLQEHWENNEPDRDI